MSSVEYETASTSSESEEIALSSEVGPTGKRLDYITWHQHHMYMARTLSEMSTEPQPSGCYVVDREHYQIASGYSGEIISEEDSCQCAIVSALHKLEKKAKTGDDFIMYITSFPNCSHCLKKILCMKISKIYFWCSEDLLLDSQAQCREILKSNGIQCEKYVPTRTIELDFHV